jgi:Transposase IS66 family
MRQPTPDELSAPRAAVRTAWKVQPKIMEAPHHRVGAVFLFEKLEDGADRALNLLVRVEDNLVVVEDEPDRQWESQFTPGGRALFIRLYCRSKRTCASVVRHAQSKPLCDDLRTWLITKRDLVSVKSEIAKVINYGLSRWEAFTRWTYLPLKQCG